MFIARSRCYTPRGKKYTKFRSVWSTVIHAEKTNLEIMNVKIFAFMLEVHRHASENIALVLLCD